MWWLCRHHAASEPKLQRKNVFMYFIGNISFIFTKVIFQHFSLPQLWLSGTSSCTHYQCCVTATCNLVISHGPWMQHEDGFFSSVSLRSVNCFRSVSCVFVISHSVNRISWTLTRISWTLTRISWTLTRISWTLRSFRVSVNLTKSQTRSSFRHERAAAAVSRAAGRCVERWVSGSDPTTSDCHCNSLCSVWKVLVSHLLLKSKQKYCSGRKSIRTEKIKVDMKFQKLSACHWLKDEDTLWHMSGSCGYRCEELKARWLVARQPGETPGCVEAPPLPVWPMGPLSVSEETQMIYWSCLNCVMVVNKCWHDMEAIEQSQSLN